jgi:hypothetical protein
MRKILMLSKVAASTSRITVSGCPEVCQNGKKVFPDECGVQNSPRIYLSSLLTCSESISRVARESERIKLSQLFECFLRI